MQLVRKVKPSKVLDKGKSLRPRLTGAMIREEEVEVRRYDGNIQEKHLVLHATDSYRFLRLDLGTPDKDDVPGPVPGVALRHIEKGVKVKLGEDQITAGITSYRRVLAEKVNSDSDDQFPNFHDHQPKEPRPNKKLVLGLNPAMLYELAEAMGSGTKVELVLDLDKTKPIKGKGNGRWYNGAFRVEAAPTTINHAEGVMMPIRPLGVDV